MAIYTENGVPLLKLSPSSQEFVDGRHQKAQAAIASPELLTAEDQAEHLLTGHHVILHCKEHKAEGVLPPGSDWIRFRIGGSTLHEALTEVIGSYDSGHVAGGDHINSPDWVASTDEHLGRLLAEHYGCELREMGQVLA